jgi:poly(hydroxyalkanoate) granule-associated protein
MAKKETKMQKDIRESAHKIWLAGLGALSTAEAEGTKLFNTLVEKGSKYEAEGKKQINKVKSKVEDVVDKAESNIQKLGDSLDEKVSETIKKLGVPTRSEIQRLTKRVEELTVKVDQLKTPAKPAAKNPAAKKPAAKKAVSTSKTA